MRALHCHRLSGTDRVTLLKQAGKPVFKGCFEEDPHDHFGAGSAAE
jgi:hypothetical protein